MANSLYLDHLIKQATRTARIYEDHCADMADGLITGDLAIEKSCFVATRLMDLVGEIGYRIRCGYEPSEPLPDFLRDLLTQQKRIV